ncbi:hypothetical protein D9Q98_009861 [Chlorella vulgaris]|uniref:Short-chain dehydrogenase n=1 Tax=Chlorella vulgaris TaxID=3077 RepID=A0A9D4TFM7_CHLVU|nr:hypothetical protein D9Q98_009861 [Chlorella vulgaris]
MLQGRVAVVTGASRGAGAGVARALGSAGATVYVTGRTVRGGVPPADGAVGTVEDTAAEVTRRGGRGIAAVCDHSDDAQGCLPERQTATLCSPCFPIGAHTQVAALFQRVQEEQGQLDLLVNAVWGGNELPGLLAAWAQPSWEQEPAAYWHSMFEAGVRAALIASSHAARLMAAQGSGLIVNVSFYMPERGTTGGAGSTGGSYIGNLYYDLAKAALNRHAFCLANELRSHGAAAVSIAPGHMRTERVLKAFGTDEQHWQQVPELAGASESPEYLGRAVAALAGDAAGALQRSGQVLLVADLAQQYGFCDIDGSQPQPFKPAGKEG